MSRGNLTDLDATATLAAVQQRGRARRAGDVKDMLWALHWYDLHPVDPWTEPGMPPRSKGGDRLVRVGGEGTPEVAELCFAELAVARRAGVIATEHFAADSLDLRHRLPLIWASIRRLEVDGLGGPQDRPDDPAPDRRSSGGGGCGGG